MSILLDKITVNLNRFSTGSCYIIVVFKTTIQCKYGTLDKPPPAIQTYSDIHCRYDTIDISIHPY